MKRPYNKHVSPELQPENIIVRRIEIVSVADRLGGAIRNYDMPEELKGILCDAIDRLNSVVDV